MPCENSPESRARISGNCLFGEVILAKDFTIIILGATGNLARSRLFPAIHGLKKLGVMGEKSIVVGSAKTDFSSEEFRRTLADCANGDDGKKWRKFLEAVYYHNADFSGGREQFSELRDFVSALEKKHGLSGNRLFYLSTLPKYFGTITEKLKESGMLDGKGWKRIIFEKPFGHDGESARILNEKIKGILKDKQIYLIDHYLGKSAVQEIFRLKRHNIFSEIWRGRSIDHIQISLIENTGVESRSELYESLGAIRDVLQSHLLQLLCLTAMKIPKRLSGNRLRDEKVKILKSIKDISERDLVTGQYEDYSGHAVSGTETFFAVKLSLNDPEWIDVPFYLCSGKNLATKNSAIFIKFKDDAWFDFWGKRVLAKTLLMQVEPRAPPLLEIEYANGKKKALHLRESTGIMNESEMLQDYENLIYSALKGNQSLFVRPDEIEWSWRITDRIMGKKGKPCIYEKCSWGPKKAYSLLETDGKKLLDHIRE